MIGQKMILIKMWSLGHMARDFVLFLGPDPNSQPSSHNYYHHLDLTLFTFVLSIPYSVHTVYISV
jgi:hypothetical protein